MRYIIAPFILFVLFVSFVFAAVFERDLYFGLRNDSDVITLQEFLRDQKVYEGPINGNFFALTKIAVQKFQIQEGIIPSSGFFGPKTRGVANALPPISGISGSNAQAIKVLSAQIAILQARLAALKEKQKQEELSSLSPAPSPIPQQPPPEAVAPPPLLPPPPAIATTTPVVIQGVKFSGESTTTFPASASSAVPLKIGDIVIRNDTDTPLLFSQLEFDIYDAMNSTLNRGREIILFLRQGSTTFDTLISKTKFTFSSSTPPVLDGVHRYQVKTEYPILFAAGETKSVGFLVENLEYVIGGTLKFALYDIQMTRSVTRVGNFSFLLTR